MIVVVAIVSLAIAIWAFVGLNRGMKSHGRHWMVRWTTGSILASFLWVLLLGIGGAIVLPSDPGAHADKPPQQASARDPAHNDATPKPPPKGANPKKPQPPAWKSEDRSSMAYIMMEDFVKRRLKAPSTADFQSIWDGRGDAIKALGGQTYAIKSYVDAQNSYGAKLRLRFIGRIRQVSADRWRLLNLDLK